MNMKRSVYILLALIFTLFAVTGCDGAAKESSSQGQSPDKDKNLKIVVAGQVRGYDWVFVGKNWGEKYGIDIDFQQLPSAKESEEMVFSGKADVGFISISRLIPTMAKSPGEFLVVGSTVQGAGQHGLVVKKDAPYKSVEELVGKTIGIKVGAGAHTVFLRYLASKGLSEKDFKLVNMDPTEVGAALQQGIIDAFIAWEPYVATSEVNGIGKRIVGFDGWGVNVNLITTSKQYAENNKEALVKFLAAIIDAATFMKDNPAEAAKMAAAIQEKKTGVKVDPLIHELGLKRINTDPMFLVTNMKDADKQWQEDGQELVKKGVIASIPGYGNLFDTSYLLEAQKLVKETVK
jgi:ABC-type nitrate/sulfonate/bicarbonate transport system substrate-binding protein